MKNFYLLLMFLALVNNSYSQELFNQNFNSSSTLSSYINSGSPSSGQFNAITTTGSSTADITGNALRFTRGSGITSFTRSTNFIPATTAIIYQFDLTVNGVDANSTQVATWQIGDGYSTSKNGLEANNDTYAQFAINYNNTGSGFFRFNDVSNSGTESGNYTFGTSYAITWVINNSGATITYVAPDGTNETVANDRIDFWVGTTKVFNDKVVESNSGVNIQDMKFAFAASSGTITMDNMLIQSMTTPQNGSNSFSGNTICDGSIGQLTLTTSAGNGPFTVVYNDGSDRTVTNVSSGVPFNTVVNPTNTTNYNLVSIMEASGAIRTSGFGDSSATITKISTTANAGTAVATCSTSGAINITSGSSATNQSSVLWTSSGTGTFANATSLTNATYTPSAADKTAGSVTLTLTAVANTPCSVNATSTKVLTINTPPTADAGTAIVTCSASGAVNITAGSSATNQASVVWTSNGTGTFANATSLTNATYNPSAADKTAGSRILTLTAVAKSGCSNVVATKTITITAAPTATAGSALSTCSTSGAINITAGSSATNQASVLWTSSGTGAFVDDTSLTTSTYEPSAADILAGSVTLTLTSFPNSPCSTNATSTKVLMINAPPTVDAGTAIVTCSTSGAVNITAGSSATNQSTVAWTSNGTGTFANATSLTNATYNPSAADKTAGSIILTLTVGNAGCGSISSTKQITITAAPTATAGAALSTCSTSGAINITVGSSASNQASILWTSSGTGVMTDAASLTSCTYAPSAADILAGSVILTLTAAANSPCSNAVATKKLTINTPPTLTSVSICQGGSGELLSSAPFSGFVNSGTSISGSWVAGPQAKIPYGFLADNSTFCLFSNTLRNYTAIDFQVSETGTYVLEMDSNAADGMGYIVSSGFTPGVCGSGTWLLGDNNSGAGDEPRLSLALTSGVTYKLISTTNSGSSGNYIGSFSWTVSPPTGGEIMLYFTGGINWYADATGGSAIGTGESFNPVGVTGSGLPDANTAGVTTFYAADIQNTNCRTATTFTINTNVTYYFDGDNDGYGDDSMSQVSCVGAPVGYVLLSGDCNDGNNAINPGVTEVCWNGIDDNCDNQLSEGCAPIVVNMATANNHVLPSFAIAVSAYPYAAYPGVNEYRFSIKNNNSGITQEVISPTRFVTIPSDMRDYNISYTIKASAVINGELVPYAGNTINVFSPVVGLVKLTPTSCGVTLASLTSNLSSTVGLNATSYIFRARLTSDNGPTPTYYTVQSATRFTSMNSFIGLVPQYGASYTITVQYEFLDVVSGTVVQSGYGAECEVIMPGIPTIKMSSPTCGTTLTSMNATISASPALYALAYEFRIRLTSDNSPTPTYYYTSPSASRFSSMSAFQGLALQYSTSYTVSVRYKIMNNGSEVWSNYGASCVLTTTFFPTTEIDPLQCGLASTALDQTLNIVAYPGFPTYRITLSEQVGEVLTPIGTINRTVANFKLNMFAGAQVDKTYSASVSIFLNGVFGPEGKACDISTFPPVATRIVKVPFTAVAYPNPFANSFLLDVKTSYNTPLDIKVYDMLGRLVEQKQANVNELETTTIGERYPSGVYNVIVTQDDETSTLRVVKR